MIRRASGRCHQVAVPASNLSQWCRKRRDPWDLSLGFSAALCLSEHESSSCSGIDPSRFKIIRMEGVQIRALIGKGGETIKDAWRHYERVSGLACLFTSSQTQRKRVTYLVVFSTPSGLRIGI